MLLFQGLKLIKMAFMPKFGIKALNREFVDCYGLGFVGDGLNAWKPNSKPLSEWFKLYI